MNEFVVTVDIDWACETAIEETLDFLEARNIKPTVFVTNRSPRVEASMNKIEVGLHPFFSPDSSHGPTINAVVSHVMRLPHNLPAFRCHRFAICNTSREAMIKAGMAASSNVCTDLEVIPPFKDRFGLLEVPIFLEDGGYLWRSHPLEISDSLQQKIMIHGPKVFIIHPMHFAINTPSFQYMYKIKQSISRESWNKMDKETLNKMKWKGRGIRDLIIELLQSAPAFATIGNLVARL